LLIVAVATANPLLPFDLKSLQVFLAVCEQGSMAAAARHLALTQPAISQSISELEAETRAKLFDRSVRPLALTPAGAMLRSRASPLLAEARQIAPLLRATQKGKVPLVRVGLVESLTTTLSLAFTEFLMTHAEEVSMLSGLTSAHAAALLSRRLDVFIGSDDLADVNGLERWPVLAEPFVLVLPASHRARRPDLARLSRDLPFLRFSARSATGMEVERHLRRLGLDLPRSSEFDSPYGMTAMIAAGKGWAVSTPLCLAEARLPWDRLRCLPLPGPGVHRQLNLIGRRNELGAVPRKLAEIAWRQLRESLVPVVRRQIPWAAGRLVIGHG
jgi:DNA-binding transcriptional LysR family regulator